MEMILFALSVACCLVDWTHGTVSTDREDLRERIRGRFRRQSNQPSSGSGSERVNALCRFNTDCISGAFCANGVCKCWSTYVDVDSYCWPKINPDQSGCQHDAQCGAVWPGATCEKTFCRCPFNRPPQMTRDGPVCYLPDGCPTNNQWPKMKQAANSAIVNCALLTVEGSIQQLGCGLYDDMYDCIGADVKTEKEGYCCPTRAFACIQPMDSGSSSMGGTSSNRFYFNPITHSCEKFRYLGAGGNANNFQSHQQCESYCNQACKRGHPEYSPANPTNSLQVRVRYCSSSSSTAGSGCSPNYDCQKQGSIEICCPSVAFVCSESGGSPGNPGKEGSPSFGLLPSTRWFYDPGQKKCLAFQYQGQGGNFNNFMSRDDCEAFCAQALCERGEPLKDSSGLNSLTCTRNSQCPSTHECKGAYCCPSKYTVCNQPKVTGGSCNNYATRFWYNVGTRACEQFLYTGCRGNSNNFESFLECQRYCNQVGGEPKCKQGTALKDSYGNFYSCSSRSGGSSCPPNYECLFDGSVYGCCPSRSYTCSLAASAGSTCGPSTSTRWFFDPATHVCKTFMYYGCDGNSNNFATQRDCQDFCRAGGCPDGGEPFRDTLGQTMFCGRNSLGSTCPSTHSCVTVSSNSVSNAVGKVPTSLQGSFVSYCCPMKSTICSQGSDPGANCGVSLKRYYFSAQTRECESFLYLGCGGNSNNFPTPQSCQKFCEASACKAGEEIARDPTTQLVRQCQMGPVNTCPDGYSCTWDPLGHRYVCCGAPTGDVCQAGVREYIDAFTGQPRQCTPNVVGSCPNDYICYFNSAKMQSYCCRTAVTKRPDVCGSQPSYLVDGRPLECSAAAAPRGCPQRYMCQISSAQEFGPSKYYCCQASIAPAIVADCPTGFSVSMSSNGSPRYCNPYVKQTCSTGSLCQYIASTGKYQCCDSDDLIKESQMCTNGNQVFKINDTPVRCDPNLQQCPYPFKCQRPQGGSSGGYCCSSSSETESSCPHGRSPLYVYGSQIQTCSPFAVNSCPMDYQCLIENRRRFYICCARMYSVRAARNS